MSQVGIEIINDVLSSTDDINKQLIEGVVRALYSASRLTAYDTMDMRYFDSVEDSFVWKGNKARPLIAKDDLYLSQLPLGTISKSTRSFPPNLFADIIAQHASVS